MNINDPTTGEIVEALNFLVQSSVGLENEAIFAPLKRAVDRLENQEQKIRWYNELLDTSAIEANKLEDELK